MNQRLATLPLRLLDAVGLSPESHNLNQWLAYRRDRELRSENRAIARGHPPGALPLPSPFLVFLVTGTFSLSHLLENGLLGEACIREMLQRNGLAIDRFDSVLDWGCGCGRVLRHWQDLPQRRLYGCDINPRVVHWLRQATRSANIRCNGPLPPLPFEDGSFDFLYAVSVLTHIPASGQVAWMRELRRVLRPGGHALVSLHGRSRLPQLTTDQRAAFERGELVVVEERYAGTNLCGAFHPESYIRCELGRELTILDHAPDSARDAGQDYVLFRKDVE